MANLISADGPVSQPVQGSAGASPSVSRVAFQALYEPIAEELAAVEDVLRQELRNGHAFVDELVRHSFRLGGKRLRPALVLLAGKACGRVRHEHIVLAAVLEMIHTATLVHDDVLDEASMRRHLATLNAQWSNEASVLVGDYLFTHAFYLASTLGSTLACTIIGRSTNIVCEGELRQIHSRGNYELVEAEYIGIIQAKTAELCACCCRLGAHYAGASQDVEGALARYGYDLGTAFQIADDLLDVLGDESATGKSLGTDLEKQKPTLPVIRALSKLDSAKRRDFLSALQDSDSHARASIQGWLRQTDALDYTRRHAAAFAERARAELVHVDSSAARSVLETLTELVVARVE